MPMDGDTYLISERAAQLGFGPPIAARAEVYQMANDFCAAKGLVVDTVSIETTNSAVAQPASVALKFRCVPAQPKPTALPVAPANSGQSEPQGKLSQAEVEKKLEDLKGLLAKGLITQEDYDRKKKDILDRM